MRDEYSPFDYDDRYKTFTLKQSYVENFQSVSEMIVELPRYLSRVYKLFYAIDMDTLQNEVSITIPIVVSEKQMSIHFVIYRLHKNDLNGNFTGKLWHTRTNVEIYGMGLDEKVIIPYACIGMFETYQCHIDENTVFQFFSNHLVPAIVHIYNKMPNDKVTLF